MKIAVITPIPTPYRDAFWNYYTQHYDDSLHIFYCAKGKADRPWKSKWAMQFAYHFLKGINLLSWKSEESSIYLNPGIITQLSHLKPDVVLIGGYNHLTMWLAMIWSAFRGIPFLMMSETKGPNTSGKSAPPFKKALLRWIANRASGGLPTGRLAERFLIQNGWKKESLFRFPNVPDIVSLRSKVKKHQKDQAELRKKWGLSDEKIILFIGRLITKKHADTLLEAFNEIDAPMDIKLIIIGDGDQSEPLKHQCDQLKLADHVRFLGFLEPNEVLEWLSISDIFALASNETWGVAPIEAAAAGKYLLLSSEIGSAKELETIYPRTTVISDRTPTNWAKAMNHCLRKITLENQEIDDNIHMDHWHFQMLAKGLHEHLKPLAE